MSSHPSDITRRDFARAAVAAAAVPVLAPLAGCASAAPPPAPVPAPIPAAAPPAGDAPQPPDPVLEGLLDVVRAQYGDRMTEQEMEKVRGGIRGVLRTAQRLRDFPLPIAAEPAFVYRVPGGAPR
ncbi:MAG TPA: hypothetical protein VFR37_01775 [Longimicrobium sp.]|nr:hypothetical protein [Longimicrobium sp.]